MGTSKGYIPPKNPHWKQAKGAITRMLSGSYSSESAKKAIARFAEAYSSTHLANSRVGVVAGGVLNFLDLVNTYGVKEAAERLGIDNLLDKHGNELYKGIIDYFARNFESTDMQIIRESLSEALKELEINSFDDFKNITSEEFLITFIINFAIKSFEACFSEKILSNLKTANDYDRIIDDISVIIENRIMTDVQINNILKMDYTSEQGQAYIMTICSDCFKSLKLMEDSYEDLDK